MRPYTEYEIKQTTSSHAIQMTATVVQTGHRAKNDRAWQGSALHDYSTRQEGSGHTTRLATDCAVVCVCVCDTQSRTPGRCSKLIYMAMAMTRVHIVVSLDTHRMPGDISSRTVFVNILPPYVGSDYKREKIG